VQHVRKEQVLRNFGKSVQHELATSLNESKLAFKERILKICVFQRSNWKNKGKALNVTTLEIKLVLL
jgi:hypothetical protein